MVGPHMTYNALDMASMQKAGYAWSLCNALHHITFPAQLKVMAYAGQTYACVSCIELAWLLQTASFKACA